MPQKHSWRQNLKDLVALSEIIIAFSEPEELYKQLTERIALITGARACLIALYDRNRRLFTTQKPHYGIREKDGIPLEYEVTPEFHAGWNFRKQGVLLSNEPQKDSRIFPYFVENYSVRSVIIAPMIVRQELLGIIAIINKRNGFSEFDGYLASIVAYQTGIILTNARLMNAEKRRTEQILMLNETARQSNSSLVLDEILQNAIAAIQKTLHLNEVAIYIPSENDTILEMRACSGTHHKMIKEQGYIQSVEVGFLGYAFRNQKTIYSNDCHSNPVFLPHPLIPTKSEACLPVMREGKVLAVMNVESQEHNAFLEGDILTLETLADQLAIAFHNAVTYEKERKHNQQMLLLSELISELALIVESSKIVKTVVERIKQRFHYYYVAFAWADHEEQLLKDWYYQPKFESVVPRIPFDQGLTGKAARTGKTVLVNNTAQSGEYMNVLEEVRSELVVPVRIGDTVVGVIDLQSDQINAFDDSDVLILETLAHSVSTALQNAESYHRMERINEKLAQTAQQKEEIVQIVAHDFRSPLTVIRGYMDFLLKKGDWKDERQKEIMETVSLQAQRLQKLAEATLKASRLDSGEISFNYEKLDFQTFLQRLIFPWSEKHKFVLNTEPDLPLIRADAGRLQEVMENLLSNAIKYSPDGGTIEVSARVAQRHDLPVDILPDTGDRFLVVRVSDEGIGIPPDKKELLFQRFSRVHDNKRIEGIGLGLYIAKKMIETHGGRIWLEEKDKGSCFCFSVPVLEEEAPRENILVVDDDIHTLRLLQRALSGLGYDIVTATDGREALDKTLRFKPHLIILDVLMPVIGGIELIERLKRNPDTQNIKAIVFTGKSDFHLPQEFASIPVISKNSGIQTLKEQIKRLLDL